MPLFAKDITASGRIFDLFCRLFYLRGRYLGDGEETRWVDFGSSVVYR